jgi:hypothetical protein
MRHNGCLPFDSLGSLYHCLPGRLDSGMDFAKALLTTLWYPYPHPQLLLRNLHPHPPHTHIHTRPQALQAGCCQPQGPQERQLQEQCGTAQEGPAGHQVGDWAAAAGYFAFI